MIELFKEFKPALLFLLKFVVLYITLNFLYGLYITIYHPDPDPITYLTTAQTNAVLNLLGYDTYIHESTTAPNVIIFNNEDSPVLSVYEGCNGLNVMIIFIAFIISFTLNRKAIWFIPLGLILIHISNLTRISLLYWVTLELPDFSYFMHKYLFTASIFLIVFLLWYWWVRLSKQRLSKE